MVGKSATRWLVRAAGDLAERQHGVVSRRQLLQVGIPEQAIDALLQSSHLRAVHVGVYAVGHRAVSADGHRLAALLACGDNTSLTHWTAGAVWGQIEHDRPEIHVTVTDAVHHQRPGLVVHRSGTLVRQDVTTIRRLTVTRPARTLLDLAAVAPAPVVLRATDRALRDHCSAAALRSVLDRHPRKRGRRLLVRLLADRRAHALRLRSELERRLAELLLASDLPEPLFNALVEVEGGALLEVDVLWPDRGLVLEADGREFHEGVVAELEDARRDALLRATGRRVLRVAWWDVDREPQRLLTRLRRELRR